MANEVYANGREIACKAAAGKTIAAFPDTCLSPPSPPAGPVPIPYPNTAYARDTTNGSTTVMISGQEVMLKDKSTFKTSTGNEAATKSLGMGVVTHTIQGEASFVAWSMDVMIEGANVDRHLDMTVNNEQCSPADTPPWPYTDKMTAAFGAGGICEGMEELRLQPYSEPCPGTEDGQLETGHHLIPGRCMREFDNYSHSRAPVICVSRGNQHQGSHKLCHAKFDPVELDFFEKEKPFHYSDARTAACASAGGAMSPPRGLSDKEQACVGFQLDEYYTAPPKQGMGLASNAELRASAAPGKVIPEPSAPSGGFGR
jgi:hypothetical protein